MMEFAYVTGRAVWIAPEHIVSVISHNAIEAAVITADGPVALIQTVNGEQYAVKGEAADIASDIRYRKGWGG